MREFLRKASTYKLDSRRFINHVTASIESRRRFLVHGMLNYVNAPGCLATKNPTKESSLENAYPRPQLQRANWTSLNGPWGFLYDDDKRFKQPSDIREWTLTIEVPFPPESKASGIGDRGFHRMCWYERDFSLPPMAAERSCTSARWTTARACG